MQSAKLASERVSASELVLNVGVYTRMIRAQIVFNHIYFSDLTIEEKSSLLSDGFYLKIIDHRNFNPRLIDLLTTADYLALQEAPVRTVVSTVLDNPAVLWEKPYRAHISDDSRIVMRALFFCGSYASVDKLLLAFKRHCRAVDASVQDSMAVVRFRQALKPLEGSIVALMNGLVFFSNPGVKDFLSSVFIEDQLLPLVVQSVGTYEELDAAWDFYRQHQKACRPHMGDESAWSKALGRIKTSAMCSMIRVVRLGIEMCGLLSDKAAVLALTEQALQDLDFAGIDPDDETACCHALERLRELSLEDQEALPSRGAILKAAAAMLNSSGDQLSLDEIASLAQAINLFGESPELASMSAGAALTRFQEVVSERLTDVSSVSELDTFESDLTERLRQYGRTLDASARREIRDHREFLEEKEAAQDSESYSRSTRPTREAETSDAELASLFATLLHDRPIG
jgi:hypothetical protein